MAVYITALLSTSVQHHPGSTTEHCFTTVHYTTLHYTTLLSTSVQHHPGSTTEHCFTTEGIFDPAAVAAARTTMASTSSSTSFTTDSGYKFSR